MVYWEGYPVQRMFLFCAPIESITINEPHRKGRSSKFSVLLHKKSCFGRAIHLLLSFPLYFGIFESEVSLVHLWWHTNNRCRKNETFLSKEGTRLKLFYLLPSKSRNYFKFWSLPPINDLMHHFIYSYFSKDDFNFTFPEIKIIQKVMHEQA